MNEKLPRSPGEFAKRLSGKFKMMLIHGVSLYFLASGNVALKIIERVYSGKYRTGENYSDYFR